MLLRLLNICQMAKVYAKGLNISGQIDETYDNYKNFVHLAQLDKFQVKDIGCGYLQTYYLLGNGQLLKRGHTLDTLTSARMLNFYSIMPSLFHMFQFFAHLGRKIGLPFSSPSLMLLNPNMIENKTTIKKAAFCQSAAHLIDTQGNMYTIGENYFGQRATSDLQVYSGDTITLQSQMRKIQGIQTSVSLEKDKKQMKIKVSDKHRIADVALGLQHTIIITEQGEAYGCGKADAYQIQPYKYHYLDELVTQAQIEKPELIWNKRRIIKAACGYKHSILLTEDGRLYALGSNKHGQCGLDSIKYAEATKMTEVYFPYLEGQKILDIKCGSNHTLILTNFHLYYMGINKKYPNPFLTFRENVFSPTILGLPSKPIKIFTNFDRIAVICDDQKAYIFGGKNLSNQGGQSGQLQIIQDYKFDEKSLIGLGFSHTIIKP